MVSLQDMKFRRADMPKSEERMPVTEQTLHGKKEKKREKSQSKKKNREMRDIWQDVIALLVGSALFSAALNLFLTPAGVALGGASGLAVAANHAWGLDVSTVILLLNVVLLECRCLRFLFLCQNIDWYDFYSTRCPILDLFAAGFE